MYIQLCHRHHGCHKPIKHIEIPCEFSSVYLAEDNINEDLLLESIPSDWLPVNSNLILITVADENGSTGQRGLTKFRSWAKYFDSYVLELIEEPLSWWNENNIK
ncbi:MAG: hypothetical protein IJZ36_02460 [Bacilli bacterium]|nr:hypothetical protein [Bacilli bacterium]